MHSRSEPVSVRLEPVAPTAELVALFRRASSRTIAEIASALKSGEPLPIGQLFGLDHDETEPAVLGIIAELEARQLHPDILVRGRVETVEVLNNLLQRWHQIGYDTRMEMELESGEPSEEALRWASGNFEYPHREG